MAEISLTGDQMLTVLETIAQDGPVGAAAVGRICDMNRTVAHRLLATLSARGYVRKIEEGYTLGPAVLNLADMFESKLRSNAKHVMLQLARETGETVVLHAIDNLEAVVIDQALGQRHLVRVTHSPGSRHPLHQGASGWALLAFQNEKVVARLLKKVEDAEDKDAVLARIERTRQDGFSISHDELQLGVHGVAVPVRADDGRCHLSLGILVPNVRADSLEMFVEALSAASRRIVAFKP